MIKLAWKLRTSTMHLVSIIYSKYEGEDLELASSKSTRYSDVLSTSS